LFAEYLLLLNMVPRFSAYFERDLRAPVKSDPLSSRLSGPAGREFAPAESFARLFLPRRRLFFSFLLQTGRGRQLNRFYSGAILALFLPGGWR